MAQLLLLRVTESKEYFLVLDKLKVLSKRKESYQELKSILLLEIDR
jgi:hypothetical protein